MKFKVIEISNKSCVIALMDLFIFTGKEFSSHELKFAPKPEMACNKKQNDLLAEAFSLHPITLLGCCF